MAVIVKTKEIVSIFAKNKIIASVYKGSKLIWEAIRSCFGKGFWANEETWNNNEGWIN